MKIIKKVSMGVAFARKAPYEFGGTQYEADIKDGDKVTILDEGKTEEGQFGTQYIFKIKTRNGEKAIALNQSTLNVLHDEFGDDSVNWIDKEVNVIIKKDVVANKKVDIAYFVTEGWSLDEYGDLIKDGHYDVPEDM